MAGVIRTRLDTREATRAIKDAQRAVSPPDLTDALVAAMGVLQRGAQQRAPHRSGALAASIGLFVDGPNNVSVSTGSPYAQAQEFGFVARPTHAKALRFEVGGRLKFTRKPIRINAQPYWIPTWDADAGKAEDEFERAVDQTFT